MLIDAFGRKCNYLRISVTDRCNLRCVYCMPPEGVEWKRHEDILTFEEILRIVRIMAGLGVQNVKVTGGEPLLRRGLPLFLEQLNHVSGINKVTLTTNGILLGAFLDEADKNGYAVVDGVNISLDALDSERYRKVTRCENLQELKTGSVTLLYLIDRLLEKQITVKINCVIIRNLNEEEIFPLALLAKDKNIIVRFIELMPFGSGAGLQPVSGAEAALQIEKAFGILTPFEGVSGSGPAVYYSLPGFAGKIGFINAVTHGFCETCNRLRLTSDGFLRLCLSSELGVDLRKLLRSGIDDKEIVHIITEVVTRKPRFHTLSEIYGAVEEHSDGMSKIGG